MHNLLITIGMLVILFGFILVIIGILTTLKLKKTKAEGGFIFWIGPFPIIGATSKTMFYALLIVSAIFIFLFALLNLIGK
jgi:uncharacterized membrane protein